jgi:hypothetical protein
MVLKLRWWKCGNHSFPRYQKVNREMISVKMTKTERLRKEKNTSKVSKTNQQRLKDSVVVNKPIKKCKAIEKTENTNVPKQKPKRATFKRIRKCSKSQPLPPTKTGVKKPEQKRVTKHVKPKLRTRKLKTLVKPKNKTLHPKTNQKTKTKTEMKSSRKAPQKVSKTKINKRTAVKMNNEDKYEEPKPKDKNEVIFNPVTGCVACEEGRQGEGEKNCWGCRMRRLQNIQNILPWKRENDE